jgi:DNA/RNA endonuclease G (NUC1)
LGFKGSCFDRGHQVPSADRDLSTDQNQLTFLMSNMIPQTANLNRFVWEHLESYIRDLVTNQGKKVYIIAGPIYDEDFGHIGPNNDIPVPSKNFKVLIVLDQNQDIKDIDASTQIISVIMPNTLRTGEKPLDNKAELCSEASPPPSAVKPPVIDQPEVPVVPTPQSPPTVDVGSGPPPALISSSTPPPPVVVPPVVVNPPQSHPLNFDWKKYQVSLDEVERLSGFKIKLN